MAETCIVCLGDLLTKAPTAQDAILEDGAEVTPLNASTDLTLVDDHHTEVDSQTIARLLPCLHHLHNECLTPWVERANSCPICRQNFNNVELRSSLQGLFKS